VASCGLRMPIHDTIPPAQSGIASAINNAVSRIAGLLSVAFAGAIVAGTLDLAGFHRVVAVTAVLFAIGGIVSWIGIRNPQLATRPSEAADRGRGA
ncbi:hypothetical protein ACC691_37665, partial [Rhizobium johnstonii]|uniref:hypothetical protein n=1 Tax=Rhizobium johnstonii TaxID=3019933 RepID=UPI003F9C1090